MTAEYAAMKRVISRVPVHLILLLMFLSLVLLVNAEWLAIDHRPPRWDESENLLLTEVAYQRLISFDWANLLVSNGTARPNFVPVLSALTFPLVGRDVDTTIFVLISFSLVVTSVCLYDIGRRLLGRTAALLAVVLYNSLPGVLSFSRFYHMDIPLAAFVTLTVWLVVVYLEEPGWRRRIAPWFALAVAMGMSAKHLYPIYVALPLAWMLIVLLRESEWRLFAFLRRQMVLIAALLVGVSLGFVYLLVLNYQGFVDGVLRSFFVDKSALAAIGYVPPSVKQRLLDVEAFEFGGSRWFSALIVLGGLCALAFSFRRLAVVWFSLAGAYGFLLFILGPVDPTYFIAAMPGTALIMSAFASLPRRLDASPIAHGVVLSLAVIVGFVSVRHYLNSSLNTSSPLAVAAAAPSILAAGKSNDTNPVAAVNYWDRETGAAAAASPAPNRWAVGDPLTLPFPNRWPIEDVLRTIQTGTQGFSFDRYSIALFSNYEWFNGHAFSYWLRRLGMSSFQMSLPIPPPANESPTTFLSQFDLLIFKSGQFLPLLNHYPFEKPVLKYFDDIIRDNYRFLRDGGWRLMKQWPLPDGSEATVWASASLSQLRFTKMFGAGEPSHRTPGYITPWQGEIGGESRTGIFLHPRPGEPASALTWRGIHVPADASDLAFGIAFLKSVCDQAVAPVRYRIDIAEAGTAQTVFDRVLENAPCDKSKWNDFSVSLQPWRGKTVDLTISTRPAAGESVAFAHTVWSGLEVR